MTFHLPKEGPLPVPDLAWRDDAPSAVGFDDIYFNPGGGLAETQHVFLEGNGLPERWRSGAHHTIGELGFGTGLNFLATWELWQRTRPAGGHLFYISAEGAPLTAEQLSTVHRAFPELAPLASRLRAAYPPRARGFHLIHLAEDVTLYLMLGDAAAMLERLEAKVDTWFLDGFAPAKNPAMWSEDVIGNVARCSVPGARAATFTVAGGVRRTLAAAGFKVEKTPGFGRKREMLQATFEGETAHDPHPWYARPKLKDPGHVAIIGAGIAGVSCAQALCRHGVDVTLIDAGEAIGTGASGTPSGLVMPRLSAGADAPARFYAEAHSHAARTYRAHGVLSKGGALHLPPRGDQEDRLEKMLSTGLIDPSRATLLTAAEATERAGTPIGSSALFFADGSQLDAVANFSRAAQGVPFRASTHVQKIEHKDDRWLLLGNDGENVMEADTVIIANAMGTADLLSFAGLPLEARYGQVTRLSGGALPLPVAFGGYAAPSKEGLWIGATHTKSEVASDKADQENIESLARVMPALAASTTAKGHWRGIRATTPDHLPLVGPVVDAARFRNTFAPLVHGNAAGLPMANYLPGLFIASGLGSRGFVSGPLIGEILAAQILGTPSPVDREVREALHPARFHVRSLKRNS